MGGKPRPERIYLLIRKPGPLWETYAIASTMEQAEKAYDERIYGKGITPWAWWGKESEAKKMLANPNYKPVSNHIQRNIASHCGHDFKIEPPKMQMTEHPLYGLNRHRLNREPFEKVFAEAWIRENSLDKRTPLLAQICGRGGEMHPAHLSDRDWVIANTVIQWLGSLVGQSFLEEIFGEDEEKENS